MHTCTDTYVYAYIHTYVHIYIHIYIRIYRRSSFGSPLTLNVSLLTLNRSLLTLTYTYIQAKQLRVRHEVLEAETHELHARRLGMYPPPHMPCILICPPSRVSRTACAPPSNAKQDQLRGRAPRHRIHPRGHGPHLLARGCQVCHDQEIGELRCACVSVCLSVCVCVCLSVCVCVCLL